MMSQSETLRQQRHHLTTKPVGNNHQRETKQRVSEANSCVCVCVCKLIPDSNALYVGQQNNMKLHSVDSRSFRELIEINTHTHTPMSIYTLITMEMLPKTKMAAKP